MSSAHEKTVRESIEFMDDSRFYIRMVGYDIRFTQTDDYLRIDIFDFLMVDDPLATAYVEKELEFGNFEPLIDTQKLYAGLVIPEPNRICFPVNEVTIHIIKTDEGIVVDSYFNSTERESPEADFACYAHDAELTEQSKSMFTKN